MDGVEGKLTVNGKISQSGTGGPLYFGIRALQEHKNRLESIPVDLTDIFSSTELVTETRYICAAKQEDQPLSVISANVKLALR